jgi:hypothetical protein
MNSYHDNDNDTNNKIKMAIVGKGHKIMCQLRTLALWDFPYTTFILDFCMRNM